MLRNDNKHLSATMNQLKVNTKQNTVSIFGSFRSAIVRSLPTIFS
jgi:hypothetical protein